jgi:hypothetical protein
MDKVIRPVQLLTLILVCLVCLTYIWHQYYDYKRRQEAWETCSKWACDEGRTLSKAKHWRSRSACSASSLNRAEGCSVLDRRVKLSVTQRTERVSGAPDQSQVRILPDNFTDLSVSAHRPPAVALGAHLDQPIYQACGVVQIAFL